MKMGVEDVSLHQFKLKPMKCEFNFLSKSDGSAILSQGDTVALVSVNGPLDIKMQSQSIEKATLEMLYSSKGGKPSVGDRYKENIIRQTCEVAILGSLYPRTGITVTIQELEDYGGLVACCVNATCLALLNAGVALQHVFACVTCAQDESGRLTLVQRASDGAAGEGGGAAMHFVFESRERALVTCFTEGSFSENAYKEAFELCKEASDVVFKFYRDIVGKYSSVMGS